MKNGFVIFLCAFFVLLGSWGAFVLAPVLQLGGAKQSAVLNSAEVYPVQRTGEATLGLQVYRANGCAACHTMQLQQDGVACDLILTGLGKNLPAVTKAVGEVVSLNGPLRTNDLPRTLLQGVTKLVADAATDRITAAGGKVETHIVPAGSDIARGWGIRHSVAEDFLYDYPVQLGSLRAGPDLGNVGARLPDAQSIMLHLYAPKALMKDSLMPAYRSLFETRKVRWTRSADALNVPKELAPAEGYEIVPKPAARELIAYLQSLHADAPLYDAPFTPATAPVSATAKP